MRLRSACWRLAVLLAITGAAPAMADWQLAHDEDFTRAGGLDAAFWRLETGWLRNKEDQYYGDRNAFVDGGALRLQARREVVPNAQWRAGSRDWRTSRKASTYTSASLMAREPMQYGRVEVVARTPSGPGVWPAIWLVHEGEGVYGEIDVFEAVGKHPDTVFAGVHWGREPRTRKHRNDSRVVPGFEGSWHTHTLEWTPQAIVVSLDGQPWFRFDPEEAKLANGADPLRQPMRLRINLALGGTWGGPIDAPLPANFDIRSVRVWRWLPAGTAVASPKVEAAPVPQAPDLPRPVERPAATMRWGR